MLLTLKKALVQPDVIKLCICTFGLAVIMAGTYPLMSLILTNGIGLSKNELTLFFVNNLIVGIVITFLSGYLSDRLISRYKIVGVAGVLAAAGLILLAQVDQVLYVYAAGALTAFLIVLFPQIFAFGNSVIFHQMEEKDRLVMTTFLRTLFSLGYIVGPILTGLYITMFTYTEIYFIMAGFTLVLATGSVLFMRRVMRSQTVQDQSSESPRSNATRKQGMRTVISVLSVIPPRTIINLVLKQGVSPWYN
jgi:SET family sugar efflux transporter-like MFS transporter